MCKLSWNARVVGFSTHESSRAENVAQYCNAYHMCYCIPLLYGGQAVQSLCNYTDCQWIFCSILSTILDVCTAFIISTTWTVTKSICILTSCHHHAVNVQTPCCSYFVSFFLLFFCNISPVLWRVEKAMEALGWKRIFMWGIRWNEMKNVNEPRQKREAWRRKYSWEKQVYCSLLLVALYIQGAPFL